MMERIWNSRIMLMQKTLMCSGQSSLFQYINRCNAEQAIKLFAERLLTPLTKQQILQQQNAVKEISSKIDWWQQFQAFRHK